MTLRKHLEQLALYLAGLDSTGKSARELADELVASALGASPRARGPVILLAAIEGEGSPLHDTVVCSPLGCDLADLDRSCPAKAITDAAAAGTVPANLPRPYAKHIESYLSTIRRGGIRGELDGSLRRIIEVAISSGRCTGADLCRASSLGERELAAFRVGEGDLTDEGRRSLAAAVARARSGLPL